METIREPLIVLTPGLRVITACSFYDRFHVTAEETEGRFVYSIGDHAWDIPAFFLWQCNGFFDKLLQAQKIKWHHPPLDGEGWVGGIMI